MAKIRAYQTPPSEIDLWSVGPLQTVSYGVIDITRERLQSAFDNYVQRGRQIAFSWEHPDQNADPMLRGAPAVADLQLSADGNSIKLVNISWTARAAEPVGRGEWPWISPEFAIDKLDPSYLCIEKIALTTNPETCGARPIVALSRVRGNAIMLAKQDEKDDSDVKSTEETETVETAVDADEQPESESETTPVAVAESPKEDDAEAVAETTEVKHLDALRDVLAALLGASSVDDCRRIAMEAAAIVASMETAQQAEMQSEVLESKSVDSEENELAMPAVQGEGNALTAVDNEDEMSAEDKKKLSILTTALGDGTPEELEAKLFALKLSERRAASVNDANSQHQAVKLAIGDLIRGGQLNPETDKDLIEELHTKSPQVIDALKMQLSVKTPTASRQPVISGGADFNGTVNAAIKLGRDQSYQNFISGTRQHISRGK